MAPRNDIVIDWEAIPCIITVSSFSVVIIIQYIHNTLTTLKEGIEKYDTTRMAEKR